MKWYYRIKYSIKYFLEDFNWMKVYFSPFKTPKLKFYFGKLAVGTPYFFPRVLDKKTRMFKPKKIGFDFVGLGWKTKWQHDDYRHEWNPKWSFVFFKWQFVVFFDVPDSSHYWECWLQYSRETNKGLPTGFRVLQARNKFPCRYTVYQNGDEWNVDYWESVLKRKYL